MARRLMKELTQIEKDDVDWFTAEPEDDDPFKWNCSLIGPDETPYAGGVFNLLFTFPQNYPFKPPTVTFQTMIYHPSVTNKGEICSDVLSGDWSPTRNAAYIMEVIYTMLKEPTSDNPLNPDIAELMQKDPQAFAAKAKEWTAKYAS